MVDLEKIEKRTIRSFYDDGLTEIALGLILLLLGGYFVAQAAVPAGSALENALTILFILLIVTAGFLVNRLLRFFKRRITYPRAGYVAFKKKIPSPKRRTAAAVVAMIISASMVALFGLSPSFRALYPALNGLLFAVAALLVANRVGVVRFFVLAAASAVIGVALTAAGLGGFGGISWFYLFFGAAVLVSGLAALVVFLRRNPRPAAGEAGEGPDAR
jgi:MFS family permease